MVELKVTPLWFLYEQLYYYHRDNLYHAQPGVDPLSEAVGAERQTALFLQKMSFLFKQSRQTVGIKLGRLPCKIDNISEELEIYSTKTNI